MWHARLLGITLLLGTSLIAQDLFRATPTGGGGGAPTNATYITQTLNGSLSAEQALADLATGILKSTTTTGVLSIAVAGDFPTLNQSTTGTAAALTGNPSDCGANQFANVIAANGNLTCAAIVDADVPNTITVDLSAASTALAADPTDCAGGQFANAIAANGNLTCAAPSGAPVTLTSTTLQSDAVIATYTAITGIAFTPAASTNYLIDCFIRYTSTVATTGINFAWDVPAAVVSIHMTGFTTTTALGANEGFSQRADNVGTSTANAVVTVENVAFLHAQLRNGANATSTTLGFTPETANSVSVIAGSTCQYRTY